MNNKETAKLLEMVKDLELQLKISLNNQVKDRLIIEKLKLYLIETINKMDKNSGWKEIEVEIENNKKQNK